MKFFGFKIDLTTSLFLKLAGMKIAGIAIYLSSLFFQFLVKGNKFGRISNSMGKTSYKFPKSLRLLCINNLCLCLSELLFRLFFVFLFPASIALLSLRNRRYVLPPLVKAFNDNFAAFPRQALDR